MMQRLHNTLADHRHRLGWSQARMAEAAGISRQSYAAIESGRSVPSTEVALRLAAELGCPVTALFHLPEQPEALRTAVWAGSTPPLPGTGARFIRIRGRTIAHPVSEDHRPGVPADGVVEEADPTEGTVGIRLLPDGPPAAELALVGCDPSFGILASALRRDHGTEVVWGQKGSRAALMALARGEAHVAGAHLRDSASGEGNERWVRELVPFPCVRISFAVWDQGLLVRPDVRDCIGDVSDLASGHLRILNREEGSGSRALLDQALAAAGVDPAGLHGYGTAARSHFAVADGIAAGAADAGVAIRAAARARGLDFLPLRQEAYELIVPEHFLDHPAVDGLLGLLHLASIRGQVEALGGYDGTSMGTVNS